jgi:hypothetical protein
MKLDEVVKSFDNQDWGDYLEHLPEVDIEVDFKRKIYAIILETTLANKVEEIARSQHTSPEMLVQCFRSLMRDFGNLRSPNEGMAISLPLPGVLFC